MKASAPDRRDQAREHLEAAVRELMTSDGWKRWLDTRGRFHSYSFNNTLMIFMQRPDATQVAGYRTWQSLERQVRKGEKAIRIFAPSTVIKRDDNGEAIVDEHGKPVRKLYFRLVSVFDVAQTEGEALPEIPYFPIDGDNFADRLQPLEAFATELGLTVDYEELHGRCGGYYDSSAKRIVIEASKPANGRVRTLVHELSHALGVGYDNYSREDAEVIVESAAYIVCRSIGLDTSGESLAYIAGWGGPSDLEAMRRFAETVDEIATKLEEVLAGSAAPSTSEGRSTMEEMAA